MTRRGLFGVLAGAVAAVGIGLPAAERKRWGAMTVDRHMELCRGGIYLHVFHRGRDITTGCTFADDTGEGYALRLKKDAQGKTYYDPQSGGPAKERVDGIEFREGAKFS